MSLATTCPNCSTCFRVVQDQLRVSEGWVRCGHCQQVFNALESLFDLDAPTEPVALPPAGGGGGRGVWQSDAAARWTRQHSPSSEAPGEREEPLSDDLLAALQAEGSPTMPAASDQEETEAPREAPSAWYTTPEPEPEREAPPLAQAPTAGTNEAGESPPPYRTAPDEIEPAPLEETADGETAFAPFPVTASRREPVFESTVYEPRGLDDWPVPVNAGGEPPSEANDPETIAVPVASAGSQQDLPLEDDHQRGDNGDGAAAAIDTALVAPARSDDAPASAATFLSGPSDDAEDNRLAARTLAPDDQEEEQAEPPPAAPTEGEPQEDPASSAPALDALAPAAPDMPSFLAEADKRERWDRPAARWAFGVLALGLTAMLVAQVAWQWRERLAMAWPVTQAPLSALCRLVGCELGAPREINAVVVDNTALARPPGTSGYRLTVQLHNRAHHPVAVPSIELALTDAQGALVARRILQPQDFDYREPALPAQADLQWTLEFTLGEGSLVGYTVAAFYP